MNKKSPPMGWNSWDCYGAAVTEDTVRANAEYTAAHLKRYGWEYIVVDIQWYEPTSVSHKYNPFAELCMDEYSRLIPTENRFPSAAGGRGFAPLAEYIHSLGLKFGIHMMRGIPRQAVHGNTAIKGTDKTARQIASTASICAWNTDMYGVDASKEGARQYYDSVFELYASWGVDLVKCDDICRELPKEEAELILISKSLRGCGRDMLLSLSPGPALPEKAELYKQVSDMWRITDDFWDKWELLYAMFERAAIWSTHAGAGHWPDADMLPIGAVRQIYGEDNRTNFTQDEQRTMMTLWSIMRSPLMIGGDMTKFDSFTLSLVTNPDILEMLRQSRGTHQVWRREIRGTEWALWTAQRADGGQYAAVFNLGEKMSVFELPLSELEIYGSGSVKWLWSGITHEQSDVLKFVLEAHNAAAFLFT